MTHQSPGGGLVRALAALSVLAASGCGNFADDMRMMCDAPKHVKVSQDDKVARAAAVAEHIARNTRSREARALFQQLSTADLKSRQALLEDAVRRAGLDPAQCDMLRKFD